MSVACRGPRVAIMQPYFLPYIGYWQLLSNVDVFVVYDDIQFTKKGWINKNRFLLNKNPETFSLSLKKASDYLDVREREISETFNSERMKLLRRMKGAYRKAPFFEEGFDLLLEVLEHPQRNLFSFILNSIEVVKNRLSINTKLVVSSTLGVPRSLAGQDRVIATTKKLNAKEYVNPIGGLELYSRQAFENMGVTLLFQEVQPFAYDQFGHDFVPNLSIVDVIMFLGIEKTRAILPDMGLIEPPVSY